MLRPASLENLRLIFLPEGFLLFMLGWREHSEISDCGQGGRKVVDAESIRKATARHCAAFFEAWDFGRIFFRAPGEDYIEGQGTLTFIEFDGKCFAITNQHVIGDDWESTFETKNRMVALKHHSPWGIRPIYVSPPKEKAPLFPSNLPRDIAIFPFTNSSSKLAKSGKAPVTVPSVMPEIKIGDILLAVGFPGEEREDVSDQVCGHRLAHVFGTVRSIKDDNILLQDVNPEKDKDISFGGMSGGPIFKVDKSTGEYAFLGIIYEGKGTKRKNENDEEVIGDDIWIYGFPLDGARLAEMLRMG